MPNDEIDARPAYLAAAIVTLAIFALYAVTLAPTVGFWDAGEYMSAAYTFGTPHPPGNPLFVLLGRVASLIPVAPTPAQRMNLLAAAASACAAGAWFLLAERVLRRWLAARWQRILGATLAAVIGATSFTVWNQSVVNEKVYTITMAGFAVITFLILQWLDDPDGRWADRRLVLVAYLIGLGYANHMAGVLIIPGVVVVVLVKRPGILVRWRVLAAGALAALLGLTPFIIQPLRAPHFPEINMGETTGCLDDMNASCVFSDQTFDLWKQHFTREQYAPGPITERQAPFGAQVGMWWLYFKWQYLRDVHIEHPRAQLSLALVFLILGLLGGVEHWRRDRDSFWFFGTYVFSCTLLFVYLLNFKYGWTQVRLEGLTSQVLSEVRDRDYFFIWSFSAWGVWVAFGLVSLWSGLASAVARLRGLAASTLADVPRVAWLVTTPVLLFAAVPLINNWSVAPRWHDTVARDWARDLLNSVEPYGVLITGGDNDTYPLWYAQEVDGVRRDVTVLVTSLLRTPWYIRQLVRRPIYPYDKADGPALYRDTTWTVPDGPPLDVPLASVESLPPVVLLREPAQLRKDSLVTTLGPGYLTRDQLVILQIIKDAFPTRPLFFARSSGLYADSLGLRDYLLTRAFARKLMPAQVTAAPGRTFIRGEGWMDVAGTASLWNESFGGIEALARLDDWPDRASANIPFIYVSTGVMLAEALRDQGKTAESDSVYADVTTIVESTRLENMLRGTGF